MKYEQYIQKTTRENLQNFTFARYGFVTAKSVNSIAVEFPGKKKMEIRAAITTSVHPSEKQSGLLCRGVPVTPPKNP